MKENVICYICSQPSANYIGVLDENICEDCQKELIHIFPEHAEYANYQRIIREIWKKYLDKRDEVINQC